MEIKDIKTLKDLKIALEEQGYVSNMDIEYAVFNAIKLNAPILIEGPAGVGKTEIALVLAKMFNRELERVQCYEGLTVDKVLYEWNHLKQILVVEASRSKIEKETQNMNMSDSVKMLSKETAFYIDEFLLERPILRAIRKSTDKLSVLLLDEIDKSDEEFEALLLETLQDFSITIPEHENKVIKCDEDKKPLIVLTSNNKRELSDALKRRCVYLYIDYPTAKTEAEIIHKKTNVPYEYAEVISGHINKIRKINLKQKPSIAESIMWTKALFYNLGIVDIKELNSDNINNTLNLVLKNREDINKVKGKI